MRWDKYITTEAGIVLASYGPRSDFGDCTEECEPQHAAFWGVYHHDAEGLALIVGDALDEASARAFAELVATRAGIRLHYQTLNVREESPTGEHYNELLDLVGTGP
jgi:hypothetical protein